MFTLIAENQFGEQLELTHNPAYAITEITGIDPPDAVINTTHNAGADGSEFNSAYVNNRQITITLVVNAPAEINRINLYKYFKSKFPVTLYYTNSSREVYINGYVQNIDIGYFNKKQTIQIVIMCPKPYFNGVMDSVQEFTTVESLFEFPFEVPLSENLLPYPYYNQSEIDNGITFTVNNDGSISVSGTATAAAYFTYLSYTQNIPLVAPNDTITLSGCPTGGSRSTYYQFLRFENESGSNLYGTVYDVGDGVQATPTGDYYGITVGIAVLAGTTIDETFEPMINFGETAIEYTPYVAPGIEFSELLLGVEKDIINNGDVTTGVIIEIQATGQVVNPKIYNVETSESMILNITLQRGDLVTINTKQSEKAITLLRNGITSNLIGSLEQGSTWFALIPGDNIFTIAADSLVENMLVTFIITDQYEGV